MSVHIQYIPDPKSYERYNLSWINAVIKLAKSSVGPLNSEHKKTKVLDIGCGRGEIMRELFEAGYECFGVDFDMECVKMSQKYGSVVSCDISSIQKVFKNNFFDIVILSHVLEHTFNPTEIIEKIKSISQKYILIAVPNLCSTSTFYQYLRKHDPSYVNKGHKFGWDPGHLKTFLECICNLRILKWKPDRIIIPSRISRLFKFFGVQDFLELNVLPRYFPLLSNSLIVICKKVEKT